MTGRPIVLASLSAAMDGGLTAIAEVSTAMTASGTMDEHRLIGGVAVMLHIERLGLDLPLRATGDADFGVPPHVLRRPDLVEAIQSMGYRKVAGNRWERRIDDRRVGAVDLLIPTYRARARDTVTVGSVATTEVPGLAEAFRRPGIAIEVELRLTSGETLSTSVVLPDAVGMLTLKTAGLPGRLADQRSIRAPDPGPSPPCRDRRTDRSVCSSPAASSRRMSLVFGRRPRRLRTALCPRSDVGRPALRSRQFSPLQGRRDAQAQSGVVLGQFVDQGVDVVAGGHGQFLPVSSLRGAA